MEIKSRLKSENACYFSVHNRFSSSLLSENIRIMIHRTIILPFVLYGWETWSLTLRDESGLRVFENRVLRRIFNRKRDQVTGEWTRHNAELNNLQSSPNFILSDEIKKNEVGGACSKYVGFDRCLQDFDGEDRGTDGGIILKYIFKTWDGGVKWIDLAQNKDR